MRPAITDCHRNIPGTRCFSVACSVVLTENLDIADQALSGASFHQHVNDQIVGVVVNQILQLIIPAGDNKVANLPNV